MHSLPPPMPREKEKSQRSSYVGSWSGKAHLQRVILLPDILDMTIGNLVRVARIKRYDLIIIGKLLYYFDGSYLEPSKVMEEIRVVQVRGGKPQTLWHAKAAETAHPALSTDYFIAQGKGAPAPSTALLMKRNAEKFCHMILDLPPRIDQRTPQIR